MNTYLIVKTIHIISSTILFGTGIGIAFFMLRSYYADNLQQKLFAAKETVIADFTFTLPAVIIQAFSGAWLVWKSGYQWSDTWLVTTYIIYITAGLCWLPVVWIQIRLRNILTESVANHSQLPPTYFKLFRVWFLLGWPAFTGLIIIFYMMIARPV
jgi:uncharacterized membrane protein